MEIMNSEDNMSINLQREGSYGKIEACKQCTGFVCCGILKEGGSIEPPYLTKHDIKQIEYHSGLTRERFIIEKKNNVTGNTVFIMQTTSDNGCIFFDSDDGKCRIHSFRPMDCRLFPLDIEIVNNEYYWALFKYKKCGIEDKDLKTLLDYRKVALQILDNSLHDYATYPVPGMRKIGYDILMKLWP